MRAKKEVEEIFKEYCEKPAIEAIALASKNGIPIAFHLQDEEENESFSTLSATILGASEVIFSGFEKKNPNIIACDSKDSVLLIKEVGTNAVLSMMGDSDKKEEMIEDINEMVSEIDVIEKASEMKEVLEK
ncbi:MAG: roadblock/LC7 domain-containing protein [Candidatus Thermoplasmatota archaeon]|nr:roadblock/LC7 domain-containing protein [Candidatus Thermoplasmatota archaeon]